MSLTRNWGSKSPAESINDWWVPADCFSWLLESLLHQGHWVVGEERKLLVLSQRIVTSTEKIFGDLTVAKWLLESP